MSVKSDAQTQGQGEPAGGRLQALLLRVGQLNYSWTNTESLLIHLIAGLADVDKEVATVIFLTLNTTRARVDLVERLAKLDGKPEVLRRDVLAVTRALTGKSALRNKYNHCIYSFDPQCGTLSTILMRISDRRGDIRYGKTEPVDDREMTNLMSAIDDIQRLNLEIWSVIRKHGFPL
jgi:hypothetical protein